MNPNNFNRVRAKEIVSLSPGIHLRMLQRLLGTSFSTTRYHVHNLEKDGEIVCAKVGGHNRLFPVGMTDDMKAVCACLQSGTARKVLRGLVDGPQCLTQLDLSQKVNLSRSTTNECISLLNDVHLVDRYFAPDGRVVYGIKDREKAVQLLAMFSRNALNVASDNLIDLWDI
jgi:predicted transcriptional regulator